MAEEKKENVIPELDYRQPTDHDYEVLRHMLVTEKTQRLAAEHNVITLRVDNKANKTEIKAAIQAVFRVKVDKVNTLNVHPKKRSYRRGPTQAYKKAYVYINKEYDIGAINDAIASDERKGKQD